MNLKGIVLAGGLGKELYPLTKVTNKHLLPVYDKPMIYYSLEAMVNIGMEEVMLVTGGPYAGEFLKLLGNGNEVGLKDIFYAYQEHEAGIPDAISLAEEYAAGAPIIVMLGDNIIEGNVIQTVENFKKQGADGTGARLILREDPNAQLYAVAELDENRNITNIEEKPEVPKTNYTVIGVYMYDSKVFDIIKTLEPSDRGLLEITDVSNAYVKEGTLEYDFLQGWWVDAGTSFEFLRRATNMVAESSANNLWRRSKKMQIYLEGPQSL